MNLIAIIV